MAGSDYVIDKGYKTSAAIPQFRCVKLSADDTVVQTAAATDQTIGVCQESISAADGTNARIADIRLMGITTAIANGSITRGTLVRADANGKVGSLAGTAGLNEVVVGLALEAASADGDQLHVLLTPGLHNNTATT
jgi:hypothetical protein